MLRRLLAPKLLVAHVVALVAVVVMVDLGFWQLRRLDEARSYNREVTARESAEVLGESALLAADPDQLAYRRAQVTGTYVTTEELLHLARGYQGRSGNHVLTPMVTEGGTVILIDRGWIPAGLDSPPVAEAAPPAGPVTVTGQLFPSQEYARFGSHDAEDGDLLRVLRVHLPRIEAQLPPDLRPLFPLYLQLREQVPPPGPLPLPAEQPELDEGPHLSYAVQWFLFAVTGVVAYAAFIRKRLTGDPTPVSAGVDADAGG